MRVDARACQCSTHPQQMTVAHGKCNTKLHHSTHVAYVNVAPASNKMIVAPGNPNRATSRAKCGTYQKHVGNRVARLTDMTDI